MTLGSLPLPGAVEGQTPIDLGSDTASVLVQFSNPWSPDPEMREAFGDDPEALASALRSGGRIRNAGPEPVLAIFFVQPAVGFPYETVRLEAGERGFSLRTPSAAGRLGGEKRPLWIVGVVPSHGAARLGAWPVFDAAGVARILRRGVAQIGVVVASRKGPVDVRVDRFSPLGADRSNPADRDLLFPVNVYLTGDHRLPVECFSSPGAAARCAAGSGPSAPRFEEEP